MAKEKNLYEIAYLLKPDLTEEELLAFVEKIRAVVAEKNGIIIVEGKPKKEKLAYAINKETFAFFGWLKFSFTPDYSPILEIKDYLKKQTDILRFLIIRSAKEEQIRPSTRRFFSPKIPAEITSPIDQSEIKIEKEPIEEEKPEKRYSPEETKIKEEEIDKKIEELLGE